MGTNIGILGVSRDITSLYEIQKKLEDQAIIDELTKAYNRKLFNERVKEKIDMYKRYESYFCIALFDIDDFKKVNDTYGHDIGDKVLIEVCKIIKNNIRNTDMLFRIGGEEFIVLYPKTYLEDTILLLEKIKEKIKQTEIIKNHPITISIGVTKIQKSDTEQSLFKRVDELMYKSKNGGKDRITFD